MEQRLEARRLRGADDPVVARLCEEHLPLAEREAERAYYKLGQKVERQELLRVCEEALIEAARGFDSARGDFKPFARCVMWRRAVDHSRKAELSMRAYQRLKRAQRAIDAANSFLEADCRAAFRVRSDSQDVESLAKVYRSELESVVTSVIFAQIAERTTEEEAVSDEAGPEHAFLQAEQISLLREEIEKLSGNEKRVVERFDLHGEELRSIASDLSLSRSQVCRIRASAHRKLSLRLRARM